MKKITEKIMEMETKSIAEVVAKKFSIGSLKVTELENTRLKREAIQRTIALMRLKEENRKLKVEKAQRQQRKRNQKRRLRGCGKRRW